MSRSSQTAAPCHPEVIHKLALLDCVATPAVYSASTRGNGWFISAGFLPAQHEFMRRTNNARLYTAGRGLTDTGCLMRSSAEICDELRDFLG